MTEETQQSPEATTTAQPSEQNVGSTAETNKVKEVKKEKCRPMTKVVIRRLPPSMTQEQFLEQVSPLPDYDYLYFAKADMSLGQYAYCRAYIDFVSQQDIFEFREKFDNYVFVDGKGVEFPAVVEFAPFQRVPKKRIGKKKDLKCGTIETDPYYINFLENLKNLESEAAAGQRKTEYSFQPSDLTPKKVTSTPLLDFLKQRKQEKQRLRDEKREEKRRRDLERKRNKDDPMVSKVLKNMEEKEKERDRDRDREFSRDNKENKDDKDKVLQRDFKNKNKKEDRYRDKLGRDRDSKVPGKTFRDRDEKVKDKELKQNKKQEDKKFYNRKEDREVHKKEVPHKEESKYKDRRAEEKRGKSYEKMRLEKKKLAESQKKQNNDQVSEYSAEEREEVEHTGEKNEKNFVGVNDNESNVVEHESSRPELDQCFDLKELSNELNDRLSISPKDDEVLLKKSQPHTRIMKRRSSLESGDGSRKGAASGLISGNSLDNRDLDSSCLRRHKSLDGGENCNLQKNELYDKEKDKKDPRTGRRIRNKDRPAMEIYRPGMGRFSKQRMDREKGSEEKVTPSQSPTPITGNLHKSGKPSNSEVRTMTFKRSVSRDVS